MLSRKAAWAGSLAAIVLSADVVSKRLAEEALQPVHVPHDVIGDVVRFTLTYNPGAAFSMSLGAFSRWGFTILALVVLVVLWRTYAEALPGDGMQGAALGLIAGGALGNLTDRLRHSAGVVDFIDVGIGDTRFWTFNVADMGVTQGAILLALVMLRPSKPPTIPESVL
ncbi:MAG: signal peptidase II [Gemmatimonadaceae bacterium]